MRSEFVVNTVSRPSVRFGESSWPSLESERPLENSWPSMNKIQRDSSKDKLCWTECSSSDSSTETPKMDWIISLPWTLISSWREDFRPSFSSQSSPTLSMTPDAELDTDTSLLTTKWLLSHHSLSPWKMEPRSTTTKLHATEEESQEDGARERSDNRKLLRTRKNNWLTLIKFSSAKWTKI